MPQEGHLFNQSISENITLWRERVSREDIKRATSIAQAERFITRLPDAYDAPVHDRGSNFSGGERQRLALARALASGPELLLLDEATSALDSQSEKDFHDAIADLRGDYTIIAIAHRLSTVLEADTVVVLGDGQVLESGRPRDLLAIPDGHFRRYYDIQMVGNVAE